MSDLKQDLFPDHSNPALTDRLTGLFVGNTKNVLLAALKALFDTPVFNTQPGAYTLQPSDHGKFVEIDSATAVNVTVAPSLGSNFECVVIQKGAGAVTFVAGTGVTLRGGTSMSGQNSSAAVMGRASNDFYLFTGGASAGSSTGAGPSVTARATSDATHIQITFNESVTATLAGWSFTKNGSALTPSAISGSGTGTLTFTVPTIAAGDTLTVSYSSSTGDCKDSANNVLASFSGQSVTNSVGATQLAAPTLNAPTVVSSTELDETWSNVANASSYLLQRDTTSAFTAPATAYSGAALSDNDTGLSASTTYYYRVKAVGNGTTYTDSPWSNVVSATTGGIVLTNITWPTTSSTFTESPTGTFAAASGAYGLSALKIPLGTSGFVMMDFPNVNSETVVLGLDVQNALEYYALAAAPNNQNYDYAIYAYSGNVYKGTNGGQPVNVGTSAAGDKYRLNKVVSGANMTVTAERSTDGGTTWTILYTYAAQTDADLFIKCSFAAASKLLVNPKGNNIS